MAGSTRCLPHRGYSAQHAIEHSDYLPTLNRMIEACRLCLSDLGLPSPYDAYREACLALSPKSEAAWSHPAVYLAGRDSNFFWPTSQKVTWSVYRAYELGESGGPREQLGARSAALPAPETALQYRGASHVFGQAQKRSVSKIITVGYRQ